MAMFLPNFFLMGIVFQCAPYSDCSLGPASLRPAFEEKHSAPNGDPQSHLDVPLYLFMSESWLRESDQNRWLVVVELQLLVPQSWKLLSDYLCDFVFDHSSPEICPASVLAAQIVIQPHVVRNVHYPVK